MMMTFVNPSAWQLFLVFVAVCFGHPRQALRPTPCDATQLHFPRATQMSWSSSTQSTFGNGLTLTVPPTVLPTANIECSMLSSLLNSCSSLSPGFYTMDPTKQAPCLCYSSNFWNPTSFDSAVLNCGVFVSTASPSIYLQISSLEDFCVSVGNILSASSNTASITTFSKNLTTLASTASLPTVTEVQPGGSESSNSIQNFTPREIGGISAGCGVAALLAGYCIFVGCRRNRKQEGAAVEKVKGPVSSAKEKVPSLDNPQDRSAEIHDAHYALPARVTI